MPELPEVETIRRTLEPFVVQRTIQKMVVIQPKLRWKIPENLAELLKHQSIIALQRRGKYLLFRCTQGTLLMHFGMSGSLRMVGDDTERLKHDHVIFYLEPKLILRYHDPRRFGAILWTEDDPEQHPLLKNLGPEPLAPDFHASYLYQRAQHARTPIKSFLMNAHIVTGIGNIYACEALFHAHVHPMTPARNLSLDQWTTVKNALLRVLHQALDDGGTTLKDYVNAQGEPGYFATKLWVYGRAHQVCRTCSAPIETLKLNQRTTFYCGHCQPLRLTTS